VLTLDRPDALHPITVDLRHADFREGVGSFLGKRIPLYQGR